MNEIYLIEKLWIDALENRDAWGYDIIGFIINEKEAIEFCKKGKIYTDKEYPYPLKYVGDLPEYQYKKLEKIGDSL